MDTTKLNIALNHKYFVSSIVEIVDIVDKKSKSLDIEPNSKLFASHIRLRKTCQEIKEGFSESNKDDNNMDEEHKYDQGKIIKKIYRVMTQYLDKLDPELDVSLFTIRNAECKIVTIIPGLDIGLIVKFMDTNELNLLWCHLLNMFIASVNMITPINNKKKEGKLWETIPKLKNKLNVLNKTLGKENITFNPFVGVSENVDKYDINTMFTNVDEIKTPTGFTPDDLIKQFGIDKMLDFDKLNEQLRNIDEGAIHDATKKITGMLGSTEDSDVGEICGTLVQHIVEDLKVNGVANMFETAKSVAQKVGSTLDRNKMEKTALQLSDFIKNGQENLRNMKDPSGNPIGENIMNTIEKPMKMANSTNGSSNLNMAELIGMFGNLGNIIKQNPDLMQQAKINPENEPKNNN